MKFRLPLQAAALVLFVSGSSLVEAASISIPAAADATLYQSATGDLANGAGEHFFAGVTAQGEIRRGLIAFDVAGNLPAGAVITTARLTLFMNQGRLGPASLHRALADWSEGSVNAGGAEGRGSPAGPEGATWTRRDQAAESWTTAGGDFLATASAITDITSTGVVTLSGAGLLEDVIRWQAQPALNFGWAVLGAEFQNQTANRFASRTSATLSARPALFIEYSLIPEPGPVWGLLLGAACFLGRRGRRASGTAV